MGRNSNILSGTVLKKLILGENYVTLNKAGIGKIGEDYSWYREDGQDISLIGSSEDLMAYGGPMRGIYSLNKERNLVSFMNDQVEAKKLLVEFNGLVEEDQIPLVERKGHSFMGWSLSPDNSEGTCNVSNYRLREDVAFYAIYEGEKHLVQIRDSDEVLLKTLEIGYGEKMVQSDLEELSREGYRLGFNTRPDESGETYDLLNYGIVEDQILYAIYERKYLVEFIDGDQVEKVKVLAGGSLLPEDIPRAEKKGHIFRCWYDNLEGRGSPYRLDDYKLVEDLRLYAIYGKIEEAEKPVPPPTEGEAEEPEEPARPEDPKEPEIEEKFNREDHLAYLEGYEDETLSPEADLSREEASATIFRLLNEDYRESIRSNDYGFDDSIHAWSREYVASLAKGGIILGYEDNSFRPRSAMTRAELATIISRMENLDESKDSSFPDLVGHWAERSIGQVYSQGWIEGYEDGNFRPDENISRAEFASLMNRVLNRRTRIENMLGTRLDFKDLGEKSWYYEAMAEATNDHYYDRLEDGSEKWKTLR